MSLSSSLVATLLLFTALGHCDLISNIVTDTEDALVNLTFSQCQKLKKNLGLSYEPSVKLDPNKLTLDLYAKGTVTKYSLAEVSDILSSDLFNVSHGLIIYIPGFLDNPSRQPFQTVNNAFHTRGIFNVLGLDSSSYMGINYLRCSTNTVYIGEALGAAMVKLLAGLLELNLCPVNGNRLATYSMGPRKGPTSYGEKRVYLYTSAYTFGYNRREAGIHPATIYFIGHSLGGHIAGYAAKKIYNLTGMKIGRISGLDPAGPCFSKLNASMRLNRTDADFVDIMHTDAGVYGLNEIIGQVDYYPNGGAVQPGCLLNNVCAHLRAWKYYAESVLNPTGFLARRCDSWESFKNKDCVNNSLSYMGYASNAESTGLYYLHTGPISPYALGTDGL